VSPHLDPVEDLPGGDPSDPDVLQRGGRASIRASGAPPKVERRSGVEWRDARSRVGDDGGVTGRSNNQELRFVTAGDGVRIAYARQGNGPPLVRAAHWLSHLELDWQNPVWRSFLTELARDRALIRYDQRGTGLSDRDVADVSFEAMVADLGTLVDSLRLERFAILGMSQGGAIAIAYAARHPERVSALVLCGAYARGHRHPDRSHQQQREADLLLDLIRVGWGTPDPKFRRVFASMFLPDAGPDVLEGFDQLQRVSASAEMASRLRQMFGEIDVTADLERVAAPTLVMHVREDGVVPFDEGRLVAASIPRARFVPLEGRGHILVPGTSAFTRFFAELREFLGSQGSNAVRRDRAVDAAAGQLASLSVREREVLELVAAGRRNDEIAAALFLSPRTVERHLSNSYLKLDISGKSARAAAAAIISRSEPG
jgi:pimeloyl-ACP methyl ester carboxylesterase/DNA-binding CsgD family transcriptional regulator